MQHPADRPAMGRVALRQGIIFGGIMGGVNLIMALLATFNVIGRSFLSEDLLSVGLQFDLINSAIWIVPYVIIGAMVFSFAGQRATRRIGKTGAGALAGMLAGLFYGVFSLLVALVPLFLPPILIGGNLYHLFPGPAEFYFYDAVGYYHLEGVTGLVISDLVTNLLIVGLIVGSLAGLLGGAVTRKGMMSQHSAIPVPMPPVQGQE
ncbi:MAG: hypothetical protein J2P36_01950 [Ktedonobacteraceae bacterium]|nr:hypothetical protein [Ktedonobacteraceae bacterium]